MEVKNTVTMTIRKETTEDLFSEAEIRDENIAEFEFPRDIVEAFFDAKIRPTLDGEKDENGSEFIGFDEWMDMYDVDDTDGLYAFAKEHGFKAGYPVRKESALQEFVDKARLFYDGRPFRIYANERRMWLTQMYVGDARIIYGYLINSRRAELPPLDERPEHVAYVDSEGNVYFLQDPKNTWAWDNQSELPKHSALLKDKKLEYRRELLCELKAMLEETAPVPYEDEDGHLESAARANVLFGEDPFSLGDKIHLNTENVLMMLAKFATAKDVLRNDEELMKELPREKGKRILFQKLVSNPGLVKDWEKRMAEAISSKFQTADTFNSNVTIELCFNGKNGSGRVPISKLRFALIKDSCLRDYSFTNTREGTELFDNVLMVPTYGPFPKCENITRITYRGKTIYEK